MAINPDIGFTQERRRLPHGRRHNQHYNPFFPIIEELLKMEINLRRNVQLQIQQQRLIPLRLHPGHIEGRTLDGKCLILHSEEQIPIVLSVQASPVRQCRDVFSQILGVLIIALELQIAILLLAGIDHPVQKPAVYFVIHHKVRVNFLQS